MGPTTSSAMHEGSICGSSKRRLGLALLRAPNYSEVDSFLPAPGRLVIDAHVFGDLADRSVVAYADSPDLGDPSRSVWRVYHFRPEDAARLDRVRVVARSMLEFFQKLATSQGVYFTDPNVPTYGTLADEASPVDAE